MKKLALLLALVAGPAMAHPGHGFGFPDGMLHPLTGADHMAAMLAVGLWSGIALRRVWTGALVFMAGLTLGALSGVTLGAEPLVLASLLALGAMVATARKGGAVVAPLVLIGGFALAHGMAHGAEGSGAGFVLGMLAGSAVLHGLGIGLAQMVSARTQRALGWGVGALGLALMVA
ncbi:HupE/UreJ family protein [Stagnihabitans tardus]|uniref:Urease accessory protein UreJ n=1 Tax=Stagnihabitans tardus TaxID=2699202 RepID=A0AAE4YAV1_9RHOB|nr:HupE/UreJ family protein [Stagnihabitans tardus]NBZ88277.1 urease accessory protein UreJ [Stagnihabitans tardus]